MTLSACPVNEFYQTGEKMFHISLRNWVMHGFTVKYMPWAIIPKRRGNLQTIAAVIPLFWRGLKLQWDIMREMRRRDLRQRRTRAGGVAESWETLRSAIFPPRVSARCRLSPANLHTGPPFRPPRRSSRVRVIPTMSTVFREAPRKYSQRDENLKNG